MFMNKTQKPNDVQFEMEQLELLKTEKLGKLVGKTSFKIGLWIAVMMKSIWGLFLVGLIWLDTYILLESPSIEWYWYPFLIFFIPFLHFLAIGLLLPDYGYREISIYEKGIALPTFSGDPEFKRKKLEIAVPFDAIKKIENVFKQKNGRTVLKKTIFYKRYSEEREELNSRRFKPVHSEELLRLIKPLMGERFDEILEEKVIEK